MVLNVFVIFFIVCGLIFFTGGAIGIIRLPDFYSRLHPAGKLDTAGLFMTISGIALYTALDFSIESLFTSLKLMLIVVFVLITSPTATHAIVDAGVSAGLTPWTKKK